MTKPLRPKPMLYAWYLSELMGKAKEMGYNLIIHGSFSRDCEKVNWFFSYIQFGLTFLGRAFFLGADLQNNK